jgi:LCP family protein required for cell wall assembly
VSTSCRDRTASLTDTMIVASLDPVGKTVSMLSLPRDMVAFRCGNGDVYGPKLNSLMSFAERNPESFPKAGCGRWRTRWAPLLGIPIHYYARIDFIGFIAMVDAVRRGRHRRQAHAPCEAYDGYRPDDEGLQADEGIHHLTGAERSPTARIRKGAGETDFTRAGRQQEVIVALRSSVTSGGSLFWRLPDLLDAVARPFDRRPRRRASPSSPRSVDEVGAKDVVRVVIGHPLVTAANTKYGSSQVPKVDKIQAVRRPALLDARHATGPVADAKATKAPKATARARLPRGPRPAETIEERLEVGIESDQRAVRGRDEALSSTRGRTSRAGHPNSQPGRAGRSACVQSELRPRRDLGQLLQVPRPPAGR